MLMVHLQALMVCFYQPIKIKKIKTGYYTVKTRYFWVDFTVSDRQ